MSTLLRRNKIRTGGHFGFMLEENSGREIAWLHCFQKASFSKCFPSTQKFKAAVFKFLWFEERFRKAPFSWRISLDWRTNQTKLAAFRSFSSRCKHSHDNSEKGAKNPRGLQTSLGSNYPTNKHMSFFIPSSMHFTKQAESNYDPKQGWNFFTWF